MILRLSLNALITYLCDLINICQDQDQYREPLLEFKNYLEKIVFPNSDIEYRFVIAVFCEMFSVYEPREIKKHKNKKKCEHFLPKIVQMIQDGKCESIILTFLSLPARNNNPDLDENWLAFVNLYRELTGAFPEKRHTKIHSLPLKANKLYSQLVELLTSNDNAVRTEAKELNDYLSRENF